MRIMPLLQATCLSLMLSACVAPLLLMSPTSQLMWALLKPLVGFDPNEVNLFEQPLIKDRMTAMLGPNYDNTMQLLKTANELQQEGPLFYVVSRYAPVPDIAKQAGMVWNADTNQLSVMLQKSDGATQVFGENLTAATPSWPSAMQGWQSQATALGDVGKVLTGSSGSLLGNVVGAMQQSATQTVTNSAKQAVGGATNAVQQQANKALTDATTQAVSSATGTVQQQVSKSATSPLQQANQAVTDSAKQAMSGTTNAVQQQANKALTDTATQAVSSATNTVQQQVSKSATSTLQQANQSVTDSARQAVSGATNTVQQQASQALTEVAKPAASAATTTQQQASKALTGAAKPAAGAASAAQADKGTTQQSEQARADAEAELEKLLN
jgi:chemotaxis protein histidine kinase CheA